MYRLDWTFRFTDEPVVGSAEKPSKGGVTNVMHHSVKEALGDRWTLRHDLAIRGISSAIIGYSGADPLEIKAKSVVVRLTTLPDPP